MTPQQIALFRDNTLTETARMIGLLVLTQAPAGEWVEVAHDEFSQLLHDYPSSDTIRRHVGRLERAGWIETKPGGRGHHQRYRIVKTLAGADLTPEKTRTDADVSNSPEQMRSYVPDRVGTDAELNGAPSSTTTSPSTNDPSRRHTPDRTPEEGTARPEDLSRLREFLGDHADAADLFDRSADHSPTWAGSIYGAYGPNTTREKHVWKGLPPEERPAALAAALEDYAGEAGRAFNSRFFRGFVEDEVKRRKRGDDGGSDRTAAGSTVGGTTGGSGEDEGYGHLG